MLKKFYFGAHVPLDKKSEKTKKKTKLSFSSLLPSESICAEKLDCRACCLQSCMLPTVSTTFYRSVHKWRRMNNALLL